MKLLPVDLIYQEWKYPIKKKTCKLKLPGNE